MSPDAATVKRILAKVNWPGALIVIAAMALYAFVLSPKYATLEDIRAELAKHHPDIDIRVAVHETSIDDVKLRLAQEADDLRAFMASWRRP